MQMAEKNNNKSNGCSVLHYFYHWRNVPLICLGQDHQQDPAILNISQILIQFVLKSWQSCQPPFPTNFKTWNLIGVGYIRTYCLSTKHKKCKFEKVMKNIDSLWCILRGLKNIERLIGRRYFGQFSKLNVMGLEFK